MNIKKVFIVVLFSLTCFPLCSQAESTIPSEKQLGYETGTMNRMIDTRAVDRRKERIYRLESETISLEMLKYSISAELAKEKPDYNEIERLQQKINYLKRFIDPGRNLMDAGIDSIYIGTLNLSPGDRIEYYSKAIFFFNLAERYYAEQLISAKDNGESIEEIETKIKKAAQKAKDAEEALKKAKDADIWDKWADELRRMRD